eukprot:scaffold87152_cov49-Prasinocladus_malaysianus.AAC.1
MSELRLPAYCSANRTAYRSINGAGRGLGHADMISDRQEARRSCSRDEALCIRTEDTDRSQGWILPSVAADEA